MAGYVLAYTGVTDKATQRKLNIINVSLFTPALLFSKVSTRVLHSSVATKQWSREAIAKSSTITISDVSVAVYRWF